MVKVKQRRDGEFVVAPEDKKGLIYWVAQYIVARRYGNLRLAGELKRRLYQQFMELNVPEEKQWEIMFSFGDPDNPSTQDKTFQQIVFQHPTHWHK